jgi:hypothetical protein
VLVPIRYPICSAVVTHTAAIAMDQTSCARAMPAVIVQMSAKLIAGRSMKTLKR